MYPVRQKDRLTLLQRDFAILAEKVAEVRELHKPVRSDPEEAPWCQECEHWEYYPCPTIKVLDGLS